MHPLARSTAMAQALCAMVAATPGWTATPTVSATLRWTAPGDDGQVGRARAYVLRYSTTPITSANFDRATMVVTPPPGPAGSRETLTVHGLAPDARYYFALQAMDDAGNWSALSNVAAIQAPAGHREVEWDLRDEAGNRVPSGIYLVRARLDDTVWSGRVAVVQ